MVSAATASAHRRDALAAQPSETPPPNPSSGAEIAASAAPEPAAIHPADRASLLIHDMFSGPAIERVASDAKQHIGGGESWHDSTRADAFDIAGIDRPAAILPDQPGDEVAPTAAPAAAPAPEVDQVQMLLPQQAVLADPDPAAGKVEAIVTAALEGPEVNLDALLGPAAPPEQPLPQIPLFAGAANGLLTQDMGPAGHMFMAGLADHHAAQQLEQAAAAGHA